MTIRPTWPALPAPRLAAFAGFLPLSGRSPKQHVDGDLVSLLRKPQDGERYIGDIAPLFSSDSY